jgi:hypothetical protein
LDSAVTGPYEQGFFLPCHSLHLILSATTELCTSFLPLQRFLKNFANHLLNFFFFFFLEDDIPAILRQLIPFFVRLLPAVLELPAD